MLEKIKVNNYKYEIRYNKIKRSVINSDKDGFDPALSADEEDTFLRSSETSGTPGTSYDIITKPPPCVKSGLVYDARHNLLSYGNTGIIFLPLVIFEIHVLIYLIIKNNF